MNNLLKISLLYCSNSFSNEEISHCTSQIENIEFCTFSLPCSGKVDLLYILKAIETGSDAVLVLTCKFGGCKYVQGNLRSQKRVDAVSALLIEAGTSIQQVKLIHVEENNKETNLLNGINESIEQIKKELNSTYEPMR